LSLILSVLYRVRTRWKIYLALAALGASLGLLASSVVEPAVTAQYQISGTLPLVSSLGEFGIDASRFSSTVVSARILGELEALTGASDASIRSESDAVLGVTVLTMTGRKGLVDSGFGTTAQAVLSQLRTEVTAAYADLNDRVSREIDSANVTIADLESNLPAVEPDGRTIMLLERSDLVNRRHTLENIRANTLEVSHGLQNSLPIQVLRLRLETATLFGAPAWVLALAIAVFLVMLVSTISAIFGQRAHTASDIAGAFPDLKVIGAPPRDPAGTAAIEVVGKALHVTLSSVSLAEIALALADNPGIDAITAHYPNDSTFRVAVALGA
jgi:hypothetical protein